jgi:hypothetical protein
MTRLDASLKWGLRLSDLERVARRAAWNTRAGAAQFDDRYAVAFGAAVEFLYAAEQPVPEALLYRAAQDGLFRESDKVRSYAGIGWRPDEGYGESGAAPRFVMYWADQNLPTPSPENGVVERMALAQILPTLPPKQLQAVLALAATGSHQAAKEALGNPSWYGRYLSLARRHILALWHEGEEPSRVWGIDRRGSRPVRDRLRNTRNKRARKGSPDARP